MHCGNAPSFLAGAKGGSATKLCYGVLSGPRFSHAQVLLPWLCPEYQNTALLAEARHSRTFLHVY
jgi:hypothetical protein